MAGMWLAAGFAAGFLAGGVVGAPSGMLAEVKSVLGMLQETELAEIPLIKDELQIANSELGITEGMEVNAPAVAAVVDSERQAANTFLGSGPVSLNFDFSGATIQITADRVEVTPAGGSLTEILAPVAVGEGKACTTNEYSVPQRGNVLLSEVAWMGTEESPAAEWIELKNTGQSEVDIGGWQVATRDRGVAVVFPAGTKIPPRGLFLMERGDDNTVVGVKAGLIYKGPLLNEDEALFVFDESCNLMDEVAADPKWPAGEAQTRKPMERNWVMLAWKTTNQVGGTPGSDNSYAVITASEKFKVNKVESDTGEGASNEESFVGMVVVEFSEIQVGTDAGGSDEFIELYNLGSAMADLTGWAIKKKSSTGAESSLMAASRLEGKQIPAGKKFLLVNESGYTGNVAADATWASSNTIAYTNNGLVLYNAEGVIMEEVSWTEIPKNKSYKKIGGSWQVKEVPEPQNSSN